MLRRKTHRGGIDRADDLGNPAHHRLPVDVEPAYPKLGHLIAAVVEGSRTSGKTPVD